MRIVCLLTLAAFLSLQGLSGPAAAQSKFLTFERNIDRPDGNYKDFQLGSAEECSDKCALENVCKAFSYVKDRQRCFLKNTIPQAKKSNCCTSGFRKAPGVKIDDN
jgi:hypothetical protein